MKKPAIVRQKTKIWSWAPDGSPTPGQTGRLTVGRKLTSTSEVRPGTVRELRRKGTYAVGSRYRTKAGAD
jgi:hypothetical protein